jgi:Sec-independent protein translocase protein TatA
MFSVADMAVAGAVALILFGPDQLPKVARKAGQLVRDVQNTSQSFIRELERAADEHETPATLAQTTYTPAGDLPLPPIADTLPPLVHDAPPPIPAPVVADATAEAQPVETVAPVRQVAAPIESAGLAQHNAIVDQRDLHADIKADQAADHKADQAADAHAG